jgi:hypothetical protein
VAAWLLCAKRSCLRGDSEAAAADEEQLSSLTELHFDEPGGAPLPFHISITDGSDNRVAEDSPRLRLVWLGTPEPPAEPPEPRADEDGEDARRGRESEQPLLERQASDVGEGDAHWKISVVQSPPWRRTSWARAGPAGRSWKSRTKFGSTSIPPSGSQFTRSSQERSPG